jgi:hypothetical protein
MASKIVTHPFETQDGRRARIVDGPVPYLEVNGVKAGTCFITGPEILKLASEGRALWNALNRLVEDFEDPVGPGTLALRTAKTILSSTASTFDHNETEEPGDGHQFPGRFLRAVERDAPIPLVPASPPCPLCGQTPCVHGVFQGPVPEVKP